MHRFWDKIIQPTLRQIGSKKIVEIGAGRGLNTHKIVAYCKEVNGQLTVIDPSPMFDVASLINLYGTSLTVLQDLSLNVLKEIDYFDVILIDGDHNWYTVYNELKLIEKNAILNDSLPIIFLHDIDWPYGKRDMYYLPDTIPNKYRHEFAKKGMKKGSSCLVEDGLNRHLYNAVFEGGLRNGVLTAIEDFLLETSLSYDFYKKEGNSGLGIITPKKYSQQINSILTS